MKNEPDKEVVDHKQQTSVVTSLAEKAMSVAAPVVPVREDGKVDQDRCRNLFHTFVLISGYFSVFLHGISYHFTS